jgi:serine/threonine protein phosphatase PrpC
LLPKDIQFNAEIKSALSILREDKDQDQEHVTKTTSSEDAKENPSIKERRRLQESALNQLKSMGVWNDDGVTLTFIGYKGRKKEDQINQDRSFVLSPYHILGTHDKGRRNQNNVRSQMMGVLDGHGTKGEIVSEYGVHEIYKRLSKLLQKRLVPEPEEEEENETNATTRTVEDTNEFIRDSLSQVFLAINATLPINGQGGCTASIAFRYANHIHFANVGDSRVFLVAYHPPTQSLKIVYETMEHKPHLQSEKERILSMGGNVHEPTQDEMDRGESSRLVTPYYSIAMSRSLGDWECSPYGKISLPDVDSVSLDWAVEEGERDFCGKVHEKCPDRESIRVFAVAATDGLMDFVNPTDLSATVARSLYPAKETEEERRSTSCQIHCTTACEQLIIEATEGWYKSMGYNYRDDITVAAMKIL